MMAARLKERYEQEIKPQLISRFRYKSPMQAPKVETISLNMGVGDAKLNTSLLDSAAEQLAVIAGQKPAVRRARKSIANFKLRAGMPVGVKVTLRGDRMYEMLDRLQSIAIPRIRDFRGLNPRSFDGRGNYSLGIKEQIIFPEVDYDAIDQVRGLDVTITTTAKTDEEARELLQLLGMPFRGEDGRSARLGAEAAAATPPPAEEPAAEQAVEEPAAEEPEAEEPAAEEAVEEEAEEEPAAEEPAVEEASAEEASAEEPAAQEPAAEQPEAEESAAEQPAGEADASAPEDSAEEQSSSETTDEEAQ
jgi:large subunit ribosomal protein L5